MVLPTKYQDIDRYTAILQDSVCTHWNIDTENWVSPPPDEVKKSALLNINKSAHLSEYLGLTIVPKKNTKGKADSKLEFNTHRQDESGNSLPFIFLNETSEEAGYKSFDLYKSYFKVKESTIIDQSSSNVAFDRLHSPVEQDSFICIAYKIVHMFQNSTGTASHLSQLIYPQNSTGQPCYNPHGVYCVKLYMAGGWRRFRVTHDIPVDELGGAILAMSTDKYELWPLLLAKALYQAFDVCG